MPCYVHLFTEGKHATRNGAKIGFAMRNCLTRSSLAQSLPLWCPHEHRQNSRRLIGGKAADHSCRCGGLADAAWFSH
jgi:hypothetical protein